MIKKYKLTGPQKSIWDTEKVYENTFINNISGTLKILDKVNMKFLEKAINKFIEENDSMRIKIIIEKGQPKQYFSKYEYSKMKIKKILNDDMLLEWEDKLSKTPIMELEQLLFRIELFKKSDGTGGFNIILHHIISDAWSVSLLISQIMSNYSDLINKKNKEIEQKNIYSYSNYIESEKEYRKSNRYIKDEKYWDEIFNKDYDITDINGIESDVKKTLDAKREIINLSKNFNNEINEFCENNKTSIFTLYSTVLQIYMSKVCYNENISIGVPILNRLNYKDKNTTGMYISTVPFKVNVDNNITYREFLSYVTTKQLELFRHQRYPHDSINKIAKKTGNSNKFNVALSYQNARDNKKECDINYETKWLFNEKISNTMDLHICDMDNTGIYNFMYDYNIDVLDKEEILNINERLQYIVKQIIENPKIKINEIKIVLERDLIGINKLNELTENLKQTNIVELIESQAILNPDKTAIIFENEKITYKKLNEEANKIANYFTKNNIINEVVSLIMKRSVNIFYFILGVLKSSNAYLPIDPEYPAERIQYIIKDSNSKLCIIDDEYKLKNKELKTIKISKILNKENVDFDKNKYIKLSMNKLAYIIYTSGTTNVPKGIGVTHKNLLNYVYAFNKEFDLTKNDVVLQQFTYSFDAFVEEVYPALAFGATILIADKNKVLNINKFVEYVNDNKVTIISCAPLLLNELNSLNQTPNVKTYISGGDILKKEYFYNLIENSNIYNTYGPTEATVCSCYHKCSKLDGERIPIGKSILNCKNYIISKDNQLLPNNIIGELVIGGNGVSNGYINNKELNKEKFIITNFSEGKKVYKTGDLCKINQAGEIEYYGRIDEEIKLKGFRVNINEIESILMKYSGITNCVIKIFEDKRKTTNYLCAYYTGIDTISRLELSKYLNKFLPNYMIPEIFIYLETLPLNISGKLDAKKLPNPKQYKLIQNQNYVAPINELEKELCNIWSKIIGIKKISTETNLFSLGIDSLSIITFQTKIMNKGFSINTQDFYDYPTIKEMSLKIDKNTEELKIKDEDILKNINIKEIQLPDLENKEMKNVLLTGSTGFLGIHILNEILKLKDVNIYCLIRGRDLNASKLRLEEKYKFYFNENIFDNKNVNFINGDVVKSDLGIDKNLFEEINKKIDTVIHCAALVKHYGDFEMFKENNVKGTKDVIDFCLKTGKKLYYISTISVAGNRIVNKKYKNKIFNENSLYIGQDYDNNVYVKSKFQSECILLEAIKEKGLYAKIFRVGNIVGRYSDGLFQQNIEENAFYNKIKVIIKTESVGKDILKMPIDMSPVDITSLAIIKLIKSEDERIIYNVQTQNQIDVEKLINLIKKIGFKINTVKNQEIKEAEIKSYLIDELNNVIVESKITDDILRSLDFSWKNIDIEYIKKIINYMKDSKFI